MSAKDYAVQDIKEELQRQNKSFLSFRQELNPIMDNLVNHHLRSQQEISYGLYPVPSKASTQLVAHCLFSKATQSAQLNNYTSYYETER